MVSAVRRDRARRDLARGGLPGTEGLWHYRLEPGSARHRRQLTFEHLDSGERGLKRGRVTPADRPHLRAWLARFAGSEEVHFALEGCTGWRYVTGELAAAGITPHLAEPAGTAALRGRKRHAKPARPTPGICGPTCWPGTCPSPGSRRSMSWRPGPPRGCLRTWPVSGAAGTSGSPPPCSTRACPRPSRPPSRRAAPRPPRRTCHRPAGRR